MVDTLSSSSFAWMENIFDTEKGMMKYWNDGIMGNVLSEFDKVTLNFSIIFVSTQFSILPMLYLPYINHHLLVNVNNFPTTFKYIN